MAADFYHGTKPISEIYIGEELVSSRDTILKYSDGRRVVKVSSSKYLTFTAEERDGLVSCTVGTNVGNVSFVFCRDLVEAIIPNNVKFGSNGLHDCSSLRKIKIPTCITDIPYDAFGNCTSLTEVIFHPQVLSFKSYAFSNCGFTEFIVPDSVKSVEAACFRYCRNLTRVVFSGSVTSLGTNYLFANCPKLTEVILPNGVTTFGESMFDGCSMLTSVQIPSTVTTLGQRCFGFCGITSLSIPASVTSISANLSEGTGSIRSITVASNNQYYDSRNNCNAIIKKSNNQMVMGCVNTTIPASVTSLGSCCFIGVNGLTSIDVPEGITSIGGSCFVGTSIRDAIFPSTLVSAGGSLFFTANLTNLTCKATTPPSINASTRLGEGTFSTYEYEHVQVYVPQGCIPTYQAAPGWSNFLHYNEIS